MKNFLFLLFGIILFFGCNRMTLKQAPINTEANSKNENATTTVLENKYSTPQVQKSERKNISAVIAENDSINMEEEYYELFSEEKPSLKKTYKQAAYMVTYYQDLEEKNLLNTQPEDVQKEWHGLKDSLANTKEWLSLYTNKSIDIIFIIFINLSYSYGYSDEEIFSFIDDSLIVSNPYCETEFNSFKIFQVLKSFTLAYGCEETSYSECSVGEMRKFLFPKKDKEVYFDGKILRPQGKECPVYLGSYTYTSIDGQSYTIPIVIFSKKQITKMALEELTEKRNNIIQEGK